MKIYDLIFEMRRMSYWWDELCDLVKRLIYLKRRIKLL